jgi:uncharacterized protein YndB with AHSA1/START domain
MFEPIVTCTPIRHSDLGQEAVLAIEVPHGVAPVWAGLNPPARVCQWGAAGQKEQRPGGAVRIEFQLSGAPIDSRITAFDPPWLLEYSWSSPGGPERPLCWSLEEHGTSTRITLALSLEDSDDAAKACAGWAAHLEMLAAFLEGVPISFPLQQFKAYRAHLAAA